MRDNHDNAFLLHSRPYTDSKVLVDFFCETSGVMSGIVRLPKSRSRAPVHRQFVPLFLQWHGANELKTIKSVEQTGQSFLLAGDALYCGLYLNELLLKLSPREEPHPRLYAAYASTLQGLTDSDSCSREKSLRVFELTLLGDLGYGFDFGSDVNGDVINAHSYYGYIPERGFSESDENPSNRDRFPGGVLKAMSELDFSAPETLASAKKLCRLQINYLLDGKPLKSRELFLQTRNSGPVDL